MSDLVALQAIVEAQIGDLPTVRRNHGRIVRAITRRELRELLGGNIDGEDLAFLRVALPVRAAIGREHDALVVWREGQRAIVVELAIGQLARRTAFGGDHEYVLVSGFEISLAIRAVYDRVDDLDRRRP